MGFGQSFMVVHPSRYTYWLPKGCHWGFFWLIVQHPVFVERIRLLRQKEIAVQTWEPGSPPLEAAATLIEALCHNQVPDIWAFEKLLFNWLWETERELYTRRHPGQLQQQWQDEIRQMVLGRLDHPPGVPDLAAVHKMERTTFSRKFKAATGQSPAAFILEVRMQEVLKRMRSPATLAEIASATGFPDAPRFSKTFRRHFGVPPGIHRNFILNRR